MTANYVAAAFFGIGLGLALLGILLVSLGNVSPLLISIPIAFACMGGIALLAVKK